MSQRECVFYNVDTNKDFMNEDGALAVPNVQEIRPNIKRLSDGAIDFGIPEIGSRDYHKKEELAYSPEFLGQDEVQGFPVHTMEGTAGAELIPESNPKNKLFIENKEYSDTEIQKFIDEINSGKQNYIFNKNFIQKNAPAYDIQCNIAAMKVLPKIETKRWFVYGVCTDFCVVAAVLYLCGLNNAQVYVIGDAIAGIFPEGTAKAIQDMKDAGAKFVRTDDVIQSKGNLD